MNHTPPRVTVEVDIFPDAGYPHPVTLRFRSRAAIREHVAACMASIDALPGDGEPAAAPCGHAYGRPAEALAAIAHLNDDQRRSLLNFITGYCPAAVMDGLSHSALGLAPALCVTAGCGHAEGSHWASAEPDGDRSGCSILGCKCQGYADTAEAADPGYLEDAAAQDNDAFWAAHPRAAAALANVPGAGLDDPAEPLPNCARPGCGHPEAGHRREPSKAIADGLCLHSGCACAAYALPETAAALPNDRGDAGYGTPPAVPDDPAERRRVVSLGNRMGFVSASAPVLLGAKVETGRRPVGNCDAAGGEW